ncbi:MAG: hypothetical protein LIP28_08115 [Deltaproteobacteria bacterium]|nr:hypothetical protein [Deltaproteobacteria bacterium]
MAATLRITRENAFILRVRKLKILLDGAPLGEVGNGKTVEFPVSPGQHTLQVKIDMQASPTLEFSIQDGDAADYVCSTAVEGNSFGEKMKNIFGYRRKSETLALRPA